MAEIAENLVSVSITGESRTHQTALIEVSKVAPEANPVRET
jgi:hypothetical protein